MDKADLIQKMEAGAFRQNNGEVLRTINILYEKYVSLDTVGYAMPDVSAGDILKSINYLELEGYIVIRDKESKQPASISDRDVGDLEAKLSGKGIKLLSGSASDLDVKV